MAKVLWLTSYHINFLTKRHVQISPLSIYQGGDFAIIWPEEIITAHGIIDVQITHDKVIETMTGNEMKSGMSETLK